MSASGSTGGEPRPPELPWNPPLRIPELDRHRELVEQVLEAHPEARRRIEEATRHSRELRETAELLIGEIYKHFTTGAPSRWGLIVSLRAFAHLLEEESARARTDAGRTTPRERELKQLRTELEANPKRRFSASRVRTVLELTDALAEELGDALDGLLVVSRLAEHDAARARASALREAALLISTGASSEDLEQLADEAEPRTLTPEEFAAELGIDFESLSEPTSPSASESGQGEETEP